LQSLSRAQNQEEALVLFFLLSDCKFGNCYPMEALSKSQKQLVFEFSKIGLIYMRSILSTRFYPTRAAINMLQRSTRSSEGELAQQSITKSTADSNDNDGSSGRQLRSRGTTHTLQIIVETNLQVIAYVTSDLHLAMLKLFVDLAVRMPNMAIGKITRERSKEAYRMGIRASQIIEFLQSHAHPKALTRESVVPANVSDQLLLWEAERYRVQADDVVLLEFASVRGINRALFTSIFVYARKLNVCLWGSDSKMILALKPEGEEHVQTYAEDILGLYK
jgi:transcription initiation factor TFIIH subunit 4